MNDKTLKIGKSLLQHGKDSDRVYIMKLADNDVEPVLNETKDLAEKNKYGKIIAKIPERFEPIFKQLGFKIEARVPRFYLGEETGLFMSMFLEEDRKVDQKEEDIKRFIEIANSKKKIETLDPLDSEYQMRICSEEDRESMAKLYSQVFESYPFPIFDPEYILDTMRDNVCYYGIWHREKLISLASSEMDEANKNTEMTDFATDKDYRGKSLPLRLLLKMEEDMADKGIITAYTISRATIPGINIVFGKTDYNYGGTLVNNTGIGGDVESMNIWYKNLKG